MVKNSNLGTGVPQVDLLMDGINKKELIEWSGLSVSGKTQLAFLTCLHTAASFPSGNVYYIDSGANFSGKRLSQLWDHSLELSNVRAQRKKDLVLKRIIKLSAFDHIQLKNVLRDLKQPILIVIDSISDILLPIVSLKGQQMYSMVQLLKATANSRNIPIIAINASVGVYNSDSSVSSISDFIRTPRSNATQTKPALGQYWSKGLSKRVYFSPSVERMREYYAFLTAGRSELPQEVLSVERNHKTFSVIECILERISNGKLRTISLFVGKYDIFSST